MKRMSGGTATKARSDAPIVVVRYGYVKGVADGGPAAAPNVTRGAGRTTMAAVVPPSPDRPESPVPTAAVSPLMPPMLAMMALTAVVWVVMYVYRLGWMALHKIPAQAVNTPQKMTAAMPEWVHFANDNLVNLFEIPVLFYALCLAGAGPLAALTGPLDVGLAWAYVALRAGHSAVHCTINVVVLRFTFYLLSCLVLYTWLGMVIARTAA